MISFISSKPPEYRYSKQFYSNLGDDKTETSRVCSRILNGKMKI